MTSRTLTGRIPELDGLRGVAIGLVLIAHCFFGAYRGELRTIPFYAVQLCRFAWSGVDLFFVLSGFLIGGILIDAKKSDHYFRTFYFRRAFRILPLYGLLSLAPLVLLLASQHLRDTAHIVVGYPFPWYVSALFGQNIWLAFKGEWGNFYLALTWSLAVEEQFYLTLPLIVRKVSIRTLTGLSLATIVAAPFVRLLAARFLNPFAPYVLVRSDALMFGVLAAVLVRKTGSADIFGRHTRSILTAAASLLGIVLLIFIKRGWDNGTLAMNAVGYSVIATFYSCLLLLAIAPRDNPLRATLRLNSLVKLGTVAYCVYLVHLPIMHATYILLTHRAPSLKYGTDCVPMLLSLALTFTFAAISWRYLEKPLIAVGHRFRYQVPATAVPFAIPRR